MWYSNMTFILLPQEKQKVTTTLLLSELDWKGLSYLGADHRQYRKSKSVAVGC